MKKYGQRKVINGELWTLVEVYVAPCGFVAHWFSHGGQHWFEELSKLTAR